MQLLIKYQASHHNLANSLIVKTLYNLQHDEQYIVWKLSYRSYTISGEIMFNVTPESYFAMLGSCRLILFFYKYVYMYRTYFNSILYDRALRVRDRMVVGSTSGVKYHNFNPSTIKLW